jgi:hypothetical protein
MPVVLTAIRASEVGCSGSTDLTARDADRKAAAQSAVDRVRPGR